MKGIKNKLKFSVPAGLAALLAAAPAQSMELSPMCKGFPPMLFELAEDYDRKSRLFGIEFEFEVQMSIPHEDGKCIDDTLRNISGGKYRFVPRFDSQKGYYFKIERSPQYMASN